MSELTHILSGLKPIRTTRPAEMASRVQPTMDAGASWSTHDCCSSTQHGSVSACSIVTVATATTTQFDDDCPSLSDTLCEPTLWQSIRCQEAQSLLNKPLSGLQEQAPAAVLRCAEVASLAAVGRSAPSASTQQTSQCGASTRNTWSDSYIDGAIDHAFVSIIASPSPAVAATACRAGAAQPSAVATGTGCGGGRRVASTGLFHAQLQQQPPQQPQQQPPQQHRHHPMQLPALYGLCPQPQLHRHAYLHTCQPATANANANATNSRLAAVRRWHNTRTSGSSPIPVPSPLPGLSQRPRPSAAPEPFVDRAEDDDALVQQRWHQQQEWLEQQRQRLLIEEEADLLLLELEQQELEEQQRQRRQQQEREQQRRQAAAKPAPRDWRDNKMLLAVMGYYNAHRQERAKREALSSRPAEPQRVVVGFAL